MAMLVWMCKRHVRIVGRVGRRVVQQMPVWTGVVCRRVGHWENWRAVRRVRIYKRMLRIVGRVGRLVM